LAAICDGDPLGLVGFGGSAHLVLQMVRFRFPRSKVFVFARDPGERAFAMELGAHWSGEIAERTPEGLAAVIDTTPAWKPVVEGLANLRPGGRMVINATRKNDQDKDELLKIRYETHLWLEREIKTVANVTHQDIHDCLELAAEIPLRPSVQTYSLEAANQALVDLKNGNVRGGKVLTIRD
jgi:propanol-preferring alcohol dehydrogenase